MDQERWKKVNKIFHAALEVAASERRAFVATASNGDPELQAEVELLLDADRNAESFLESPAIPAEMLSAAEAAPSPSPVHAGDELCERFRILRPIGEGGMGHVFEAFDTELAVDVALKVIRPEIAANPIALARFRQEVRLARRITHPNVCRTFDIEREVRVDSSRPGAAEEVVFFTMEFLEGETLASRLQRSGPLPLEEALSVAQQIADALQAAHSIGIVHRDMKPANIILVRTQSTTAGFRAVITDFGLARIDPIFSGGDLSRSGHSARPIGTLAYMAPEQLEAGSVSAATDVYGFGLVLFEMVTGARAFPSDQFLSGITQRLTGLPPSPQKLVPALPDPWCRAIEGCLQIKPGDRFQSAMDVISVLEGSRSDLPRSPNPSSRQHLQRTLGSPRLRFLAFLFVSLLAVALFLVVLRLHRSEADAKVPSGALVYLAPVKNQTREKAFDNLSGLIEAGLAQSAQINLVDRGRVGDIMQQMTKSPGMAIDEPMAREIAMRAGAVRVIFVTVTEASDTFSLNVDLQQPDNTPSRYRDHWSKSFSWPKTSPTESNSSIPPELLTEVRRASDWIRNQVGESANDIARLDTPPEDVTTGSWPALAAYTYAEKLASEAKRDEAASAFRSAIQSDPNFALAYARLGDVLVNLDEVDEGYRDYRRALEEKDGNRLSLRERDRIVGIYAQDTGDFQASENAFREYCLYYGQDYVGWFYRARPLSMLGRTSEAIEVLKRAHQADPNKRGALEMLVRQYLLLGDLGQAHNLAAQLRSMHDFDGAESADGTVDFVEGNYPSAMTAFEALQKSEDPLYRAEGERFLVDLEAERGDDRAARDLVDRAIADNPEDASRLLDRAYLDGTLGEFSPLTEDLKSAIRKDKSPYTLVAASDILGQFLPRARGAAAEHMKTELESLARALPADDLGIVTEDARIRIEGEVLLARDDARGALPLFRKADKLEAPVTSRDYLGRALEATAAQAQDRATAHFLRQQAMAAYASIAMHPAEVWQFPIAYPPGFYADQLGAWLHTADGFEAPGSTRDQARGRYRTLRPHGADTLLPSP